MEKFFKVKESGSAVRTEIVAGLTTFFAMAYIVLVAPNQLTNFDPELGKIFMQCRSRLEAYYSLIV